MRLLVLAFALLLAAPAQASPSFWSFFHPQASHVDPVLRHASQHRNRTVRTGHLHPAHAAASDRSPSFETGSSLVEAARREIGNGAIYGRSNLWCARFLNYVLARTGHHGTGSDLAASFATLPHTEPHVGAIAVMRRRGGGHVGVVSGVTSDGDPIIISGNSSGRVQERVYPRQRITTYVEAR